MKAFAVHDSEFGNTEIVARAIGEVLGSDQAAVEEIEKTAIPAFFIRIFGDADKPFGDTLKKKGGDLVLSLEGFLVERIKGPLVEGELERAQTWAKMTGRKRSLRRCHPHDILHGNHPLKRILGAGLHLANEVKGQMVE